MVSGKERETIQERLMLAKSLKEPAVIYGAGR